MLVEIDDADVVDDERIFILGNARGLDVGDDTHRRIALCILDAGQRHLKRGVVGSHGALIQYGDIATVLRADAIDLVGALTAHVEQQCRVGCALQVHLVKHEVHICGSAVVVELQCHAVLVG